MRDAPWKLIAKTPTRFLVEWIVTQTNVFKGQILCQKGMGKALEIIVKEIDVQEMGFVSDPVAVSDGDAIAGEI